MANTPIRFMANNMLSASNFTYSSQLTAFPASNIFDEARSRVWKFAGNFTITSSNKVIYINDGGNKTINLTEASYTGSSLASHIQTQLNASSSLWTVSYSAVTLKFTFSRGGSGTLRFSQTTNAAWDSLGFTATSDDNTGPWDSDEIRIHTNEWAEWDFKIALMPTFLSLISGQSEVFTLTPQATIRLRLNNVHDFSAPPIDLSFNPTSLGLYKFLDDQVLSSYRYARIDIIDRMNPLGPSKINISNIYLGDYVTVDILRNVAPGFTKTLVDPSNILQSEGGSLFFDKKIKYLSISGCTIELLNGSDRDDLEQLFSDLGKSSHFFVSFDPGVAVTTNLEDLTRYVVMTKDPSLNHIFRDYYTFSFDIREAV